MRAQPHADLIQAFEDNRRALRASSVSYDAGNLWEANRLATTVFNLVHTKGQTNSILTQLGMLRTVNFFSSVRVKEPGTVTLASFGSPLAAARITSPSLQDEGVLQGKIDYMPYLDEFIPPARGYLNFAEWWGETIFVNNVGTQLSRYNLAYHLRSKDGGSHYDANIKPSPYLDFKMSPAALAYLDNAIGAVDLGKHVEWQEIYNGHLATMRQIAWEVEKTLEHIPLTTT